jgi:hypothetical protein
MGGVVSDVVGGVGDLVGGAVDTVKDVAGSDLGKAALLGGAAYFGAPMISNALGIGGTTAAVGSVLGPDNIDIGGGFNPAGVAPSLFSNLSTGQMLGLGAGALALGGGLGGNKPTSSTTTTAIDPEMKAAYLRNLEEARTTAAGLGEKQLADFTAQYGTAEQQLESLGLGGAGQRTTNEAARLAMQEAGYTPQQIEAAQINRANIANVTGQLGSQFMSAYQNPYEQQVVQGALGDIERQRRISQQAQQARASAARAFGGSRQAVAEALANEDYTRQAANTAAQLRQQGFTTAAQLGQTDAARMLQAQLANQGVDVSLAQANAQLLQNARLANQSAFAQGAGIRQGAIGQLGALGAQQQNLGMTGAQAVMNAQQQRQALAQARLDAARNLELERLGIRQSALGLQPANLGGTQTSPIYRNTGASALGGALSGGMLGNLIGGSTGAGYGALLGGGLGLLG